MNNSDKQRLLELFYAYQQQVNAFNAAKPSTPTFSGHPSENPAEHVKRLCQHFIKHQVPIQDRLRVTAESLTGEAAIWYKPYVNLIDDCKTLCSAIVQKFSPRTPEDEAYDNTITYALRTGDYRPHYAALAAREEKRRAIPSYDETLAEVTRAAEEASANVAEPPTVLSQDDTPPPNTNSNDVDTTSVPLTTPPTINPENDAKPSLEHDEEEDALFLDQGDDELVVPSEIDIQLVEHANQQHALTTHAAKHTPPDTNSNDVDTTSAPLTTPPTINPENDAKTSLDHDEEEDALFLDQGDDELVVPSEIDNIDVPLVKHANQQHAITTHAAKHAPPDADSNNVDATSVPSADANDSTFAMVTTSDDVNLDEKSDEPSCGSSLGPNTRSPQLEGVLLAEGSPGNNTRRREIADDFDAESRHAPRQDGHPTDRPPDDFADEHPLSVTSAVAKHPPDKDTNASPPPALPPEGTAYPQQGYQHDRRSTAHQRHHRSTPAPPAIPFAVGRLPPRPQRG